MHGLSFTTYDTKRFEAGLDAVAAEVAFFSFIFFTIKIYCTVRAGPYAHLAAIAGGFIQSNDAVFVFYDSFQRARLCARRTLTVVAQCRQKVHFQVRKTSFGYIFVDLILSFHLNPAYRAIIFDLTDETFRTDS